MKKSVMIQLDKIRNLRYGMNALVTIEELTGKSITKIDLSDISMKDLRTILFAGLYHEDKELTPEKVGNLIDEHGNLSEIAEKLERRSALHSETMEKTGKAGKRGSPRSERLLLNRGNKAWDRTVIGLGIYAL
jgi:hypothetical protein